MKKAITIVLLSLTLSASSFACPFHHLTSGVVIVGKDTGKLFKSVGVGAWKVAKYLVS